MLDVRGLCSLADRGLEATREVWLRSFDPITLLFPTFNCAISLVQIYLLFYVHECASVFNSAVRLILDLWAGQSAVDLAADMLIFDRYKVPSQWIHSALADKAR